MESLKKRLSPAAGQGRGGEVILVAGIGEGREVEMRLPGRFVLDAALRGALKTSPGVVHLEDA
jgi:DNA polymerase-3 subunit alpha